MRNGAVSDDLIEFHRRVAAGGVGMTTVAYCAVSRDGRVQRHTLVMEPERVPDLTRLTEAVHAEGAAIQAQLGHAGLVANTRSNGMPTLALHPVQRTGHGPGPRATPSSLDRVVEGLRHRHPGGRRLGVRLRRGPPGPQPPAQLVSS